VSTTAERRLFDAAAKPFSRVGVSPWVFARFKLSIDPVYREILKQGILPSAGRILDLGCGQALTLSAIHSAQRFYQAGDFPAGWRAPPHDVELCGFDIREKEVSIANRALSGVAQISTADLRDVELPSCRAAVVLDALHYLEPHEQERLLQKMGQAIERGGTIIVREADASAGRGFDAVKYSETFRARLRGQWRQRFYYRSAEDWARLIASMGFETDVQSMGGRTPFRNVLVHGIRSSP
jgi:trans-aconitate methyltransferase